MILALVSLAGTFAALASPAPMPRVPPRPYQPPGRRTYSPVTSFNLDPQKVANTSVRVAAREGRLEILQDAVKRGGQLDAASDDGVTALMYAAWGCHVDVVDYLLEKGARVNAQDKRGRTPLMFAARGACLPVVKSLLENPRTDLRLRDARGWSAYRYARKSTAIEVGGPAHESLRLIRQAVRERRK